LSDLDLEEQYLNLEFELDNNFTTLLGFGNMHHVYFGKIWGGYHN